MFKKFFARALPSVRADDEEEELVDPQQVLRVKFGSVLFSKVI